MANYVHLHVCFPCSDNTEVAKLAGAHLAKLDEDFYEESRWFLEDLSERSGGNRGPKGGLSLWGIVGDWVMPTVFVYQLRPFWEELLTGRLEEGPRNFEHINVFSEHGQQSYAMCQEIYWDDPESSNRKLVVKVHDRLPFSWQQF